MIFIIRSDVVLGTENFPALGKKPAPKSEKSTYQSQTQDRNRDNRQTYQPPARRDYTRPPSSPQESETAGGRYSYRRGGGRPRYGNEGSRYQRNRDNYQEYFVLFVFF